MNRVRTSPRVKMVEDLRWHCREKFSQKLKVAFEDKFIDIDNECKPIEIETGWNVFAGKLVTSRVDGELMTPEQQSFIAGFETAWLDVQAIAEHIK